jgi:ankyrin repeat protein
VELDQELVGEFVLAAHFNFPKVQALYHQNPALLDATWQKFNERAIEAASHMGARAIAEFLLERGAPMSIFTAAMLGDTEQVAQFLKADPPLARSKGVHGISILYHAALSGNTEIANLLMANGGGEGANDALHAAVKSGHLEMVERLLAHGVDDVNALNFDKKTPLQVALERGFDEIVSLLRARGGQETTGE